jgi:hypothetical protein
MIGVVYVTLTRLNLFFGGRANRLMYHPDYTQTLKGRAIVPYRLLRLYSSIRFVLALL